MFTLVSIAKADFKKVTRIIINTFFFLYIDQTKTKDNFLIMPGCKEYTSVIYEFAEFLY